ncbi:MAG: FAD-dependent monooxygenase [Bacteroidota bacterium]|nr:FAD-dependent monooxygenase [Bacteroidota bacterium]
MAKGDICSKPEEMMKDKSFGIIGAGLVGSLLALMLSRRGFTVDVFERRSDPRIAGNDGGRSINLALSDRGLQALEHAGLKEEVRQLCIPMHGRMVHDQSGDVRFMPYGKEGQFINSVSRGGLNTLLLNHAVKHENVRIHFGKKCEDSDILRASTFTDSEVSPHTFDILFGTDGAYSATRLNLMKTDRFDFSYRQDYLDHGYKELTIPASEKGGWRLESNALHIWPRKSFMMIALPNLDGSFTCTLFLAMNGEISFEHLTDKGSVTGFFKTYFSDAVPHMPTLTEDFFSNPTSSLVTMYCDPWYYKDKLLLMGDAAHAVVPFYGQGMNAGFEDCYILEGLIDKYSEDWGRIFGSFYEERKPNTDAIAELALRNFIEMRDLVADPHFILKNKIDKKIASLYPDHWMPLYSMVTFSKIPYSEALRLGNEHDRILESIVEKEKNIEMLLESGEFDKVIRPYIKY